MQQLRCIKHYKRLNIAEEPCDALCHLKSCQLLVLIYLLLWRSPRLRSQSPAFCHVHYPSQYSYLLLNHHLYADDTQLFFLLALTHLQLKHYSPTNCPSPNLFLYDCQYPINSSKTEFVLIGLNKQLDKIRNSSCTQHSPLCPQPRLHLDEYLTFSDQISAVSKSCYIVILDSFVVSVLTLILPQLAPRPIATFTIHSKLDYCNSLYYNLPKSHDNPPPTYSELSCTCCCQSC